MDRLGFSLLIAALFSGALPARAFKGSDLTHEVFREYCWRHRRVIRGELRERPAIGSTLFVPTHLIDASQNRYSFYKQRKAMKKATYKVKDTYYDPGLQQWRFAYDNNQSLFSLDQHLIGIYHRGRIQIVDGHHRGRISTYMGAPSLPMHFIGEDWDHLDKDEFQRHINGDPLNLAHWFDTEGHPELPLDLCDMLDDPYLTLARLILRRVDIVVDKHAESGYRLREHRGADRIIVVKVNRDIAFLELELAKAFRRHGVNYTTADIREPLNDRHLMQLRRILALERKRPGSRLENLFLLDKPTNASKIDFLSQTLKHVKDSDCAHLLHEEVAERD